MRNQTESKVLHYDTSERYIIYQLWVSPLENRVREAVGYGVVGYVESIDEAEEICTRGRDFDVNDCWAISGKSPEFIYEAVKLVKQIID